LPTTVNWSFALDKLARFVRNSPNMKPSIPPSLITFALVYFALVQNTQAVSPPPDGGYAGNNTAEGTSALFSLTSGVSNTALGYQTLYNNTTGSYNSAEGFRALFANTTGAQNTATGSNALTSNTTGSFNTANGLNALFSNTTGSNNTAIGLRALSGSGSENTAIGVSTLSFNHSGNQNTAVGVKTLYSLFQGNNNIALGYHAGFAVGGQNQQRDNNIEIGNVGDFFDNNTTRIGDVQTATFIAGIRGQTTGQADALPVLIDSAGQLGTASSSRRFKTEIKPMDKTSEAILALKPVTFHYKSDTKDTPQFGLIAEDVAKVNPDLIVRDKNGEVYTVRYEAVNAMLLNEFLKEHRKNEEQEKTIAELKSGVTALAATVKEQAAQIQKVSAQLEASKPAPQVVNNP